jgi:phosphate transport system substrate-binding protein
MNTARTGILAVTLAWVSAQGSAASLASPDVSVPFPKTAPYIVGDAICVVGYNDMSEMLGALDLAFSVAHPQFRFRLLLPSTRAAPPALMLGLSAFAPMGAEFSAAELSAYHDMVDLDPQMYRIAHASLNPRARSAPLAIYVHRDNPLSQLDLEQAARIFTTRTGDAVTTWDQLGLGGEWAGRPVHPEGLSADTALGTFMRVHQFAGQPYRAEFRGYPQSTQVIEHIGQDPLAIGFADLNLATAAVKVVAIADTPGAVARTGTAADIESGRYALDRFLYLYVRRIPGRPLEPWLREYLRFVLSPLGQRTIASGTLGYMPLNASEVRAELAKLDEPAPGVAPAQRSGAPSIACAGGDTMQALADSWAQGFHRSHPSIRLTIDRAAKLSADGFAALLDGRLNCVLMVREPFPAETHAFTARFGHGPGLLQVAGGSFDTRGGTHAIAIFVNAANPLRELGLEQLHAILAQQPQPGARPLSRWGELGLADGWENRPIHVYGMLPQRSSGNPPGIVNFLQQRVLRGGAFRDDLRVQVDAPGDSALQAIVEQVASDPEGIGYSGFGFALPGTRALAIGATHAGPFITGSPATVADRSYPLSRSIYIAFDPEAIAAPRSPLRSFLDYVLSREGQRAVGKDPEGFLPLTATETRRSRRALTALSTWRCQ